MEDSHLLILKYFPDLTSHQVDQFKRLGAVFQEWNHQINLVSRNDVEYLYQRHILHSLAIAKVVQFAPGTKILDVGTGGGFPGVPLSILFPDTSYYLVDSIGKKVKVVADIISQLEITNAKAMQIRAEDVSGTFDFVVSRAVTDVDQILNWISDKISPKGFNQLENGLLYLKGGTLGSEQHYRGLTTYPLSRYFDEVFFETKLLIHLPIFFSLSQKN